MRNDPFIKTAICELQYDDKRGSKQQCIPILSYRQWFVLITHLANILENNYNTIVDMWTSSCQIGFLFTGITCVDDRKWWKFQNTKIMCFRSAGREDWSLAILKYEQVGFFVLRSLVVVSENILVRSHKSSRNKEERWSYIVSVVLEIFVNIQ